MTDWDLLTPGIGLTSIGIVGVGISLSGIAKTFLDGMHAVSLLTLYIGMIFLASGLFKDGFPTSGRAKSATFITLGFLVTFGFAAAVTVSTSVPSIFIYIGLMLTISIPAAVIAYAAFKRSPYLKAITIIFIAAALVGGITFYAFGLVVPKISSTSEEKSTNQTASSGAQPATIIKATILPGASAQGNPGYDPSSLNVKKGDGIEWTNKDNAPHTVTSLKDDGKSFDSQLIKASGTWTLDTSKLTGSEYDYFCTIHPHMKAKFTIGSAGAEANAKPSGAGSGQPNIKVAIPKDAQSPSASVFYKPATAQVKPGSSVVWENQDTVPHTATSGDSKKAAADKIFDTGIISPGQSSKPVIMPSKEGEIPYFCQVHPYMVGKIMVGADSAEAEAAAGAPPPPPTNATKQT